MLFPSGRDEPDGPRQGHRDDLRRRHRRRRHHRGDPRAPARAGRQARARARGGARRGPLAGALRGLPAALLRDGDQGQPGALSDQSQRALPARRPAQDDPRPARQRGLHGAAGAVPHRHRLHARARRHDDALGSEDPALPARGFRDALALRRRARLAGELQAARTLSRDGRARDRRLGGCRGSNLSRPRPSRRATCSRCTACRCPTSTGRSTRGLRGTHVELDGERFELGVRPYPQGRNAIPNKAYDGGKGFHARRRGLDQPGRGRRPLPGQQCLRADLPRAGQVQFRQDARQGAAERARRSVDPGGRLARDRRRGRPRHRDRGQALPRRRLARARDRHRARPHLRAQRQRDRDAAPHARLGPAEHERARRQEPDGPRLPAHVGVDAAGLRHDARHQLHRRHRRAARRRVPPPARPPSPPTSTTTAGAGPRARPTPTSCAWWRRATSSGTTCAAPSSTRSPASCSSPSWSTCRRRRATASPSTPPTRISSATCGR